MADFAPCARVMQMAYLSMNSKLEWKKELFFVSRSEAPNATTLKLNLLRGV
jgi:hypothetical protein